MSQKYIVGDLVKVWLDLDIKYQVAEVMGYNPTYQKYILTNWYIEETRGAISVAEDRIMPIPLTPEILEKNEWKKSKINDCAYFYYKDGSFLTYTSKDGKFWFDDFDYSSGICVELPYVHSLQHLFFGMGIKNEMEV